MEYCSGVESNFGVANDIAIPDFCLLLYFTIR